MGGLDPPTTIVVRLDKFLLEKEGSSIIAVRSTGAPINVVHCSFSKTSKATLGLKIYKGSEVAPREQAPSVMQADPPI